MDHFGPFLVSRSSEYGHFATMVVWTILVQCTCRQCRGHSLFEGLRKDFCRSLSGTQERGVTQRGVFAFACQCIVCPCGWTGNRTVTEMQHPLLVEGRPSYARQLLASTLSAPRVTATSYCDPGRHANVITPCLLTPSSNVPKLKSGKRNVPQHVQGLQQLGNDILCKQGQERNAPLLSEAPQKPGTRLQNERGNYQHFPKSALMKHLKNKTQAWKKGLA